MKSRLLAAYVVLFLFSGLLGLAAYNVISPPKPILITPIPDDSTREPYRVYGDPSEYQIVYLIAPEVEASQNDVIASIPVITQAKVAHNWQAVLDFHRDQSIEAIIIDRSAYAMVDKSWTAAMSRKGLVIATINMYAEQQIELRDSDCDRQKPPKMSPFDEDYFLVTVHLIQTEDPAELDRAIETSYTTCKLIKSTSRVYETSNGTHRRLKTSDDVKYLTNTLIGDISMIREAKASHASLTVTPTTDPEFDSELD
jgi:hypothetical protein